LKKIFLLITLVFLFTPNLYSIIAKESQLELIPFETLTVEDEIYNGPINEEAAFQNIVIFIRFADETDYVPPYSYNEYDDLFNSEIDESLRSYFLEVSYGQLTIDSYLVNDGTTYIFYQDEFTRNYYEPYDETLNPVGYQEGYQASVEHPLLKRAIDYVEDNNLVPDDIVLDSNDDGKIDSITFMVSKEDTTWNTLFWPHKWSLHTYYNQSNDTFSAEAPTINGVNAYDYTFELLGNSRSYNYRASVGILAHETFHLISAPDLYHYYAYDYINPIGPWGLMESVGPIPNHMLGYMKETYGNWITDVTEITTSDTYTLEPLSESGSNLYKIDLGYSNEFVYIEYRERSGIYEVNLPESGLIVYRVDLDYYDEGNVYGYYDSEGNPADEVFIFRPGISFNPLPITFPDFDDELIDEDGIVEQAALSQNNQYDEMGIGTDIPMFYSDGTLMEIIIENVIEYDGYISFDVLLQLPPTIELLSDFEIPEHDELYLFDGFGFEYRAQITNISDNGVVYYTTDGSLANDTKTLYEGEIIYFDSRSNVINVAVYTDGIKTSIASRTFNFVTEITTDHGAYGDSQNIIWYLDLKDESNVFDMHFSEDCYMETGYDFLYIIRDSETVPYTGYELANLDLSYSEDILLQFVTDWYTDTFYGFSVEVYINDSVDIYLYGEQTVYLEAGDEYIELGAYIADGVETDTIDISGVVLNTLVGNYIVTYKVVDENLIIKKIITREVIVIDTTSPTITINGLDTIYLDVFNEYIEESVTYSDNSTGTLNLVITGEVDYNTIGSYIVEYQVFDSEGNASIIIERTVIVEDNIAPTILLNESVDTVYKGENYIHTYMVATDNYSNNLDIVIHNNVNTSLVGTYIIEYIVTDESENVTVTYRYVNVLERETNYELFIGKTINTIKIGEDFIPADCFVINNSAVNCEIDLRFLNNSIEGTYAIKYFVTIDGIEYSHVSYVFVYDDSSSIVWHYDKSRRDYL